MRFFNQLLNIVQISRQLIYAQPKSDKHHISLFGRCGDVKAGEGKPDSASEKMSTVFVEQPLALSGSAKRFITLQWLVVYS